MCVSSYIYNPALFELFELFEPYHPQLGQVKVTDEVESSVTNMLENLEICGFFSGDLGDFVKHGFLVW